MRIWFGAITVRSRSLGGIAEILGQRLVALGARALVADRQIVAGLHRRAALADFGADAEDLEADIDAVDHRALVGILRDEIAAEEAHRVQRRRRGQANDERVEIVEHLPPSAVDRSMAFVGDDEIEALDRDGRIVGDDLFAFGRRRARTTRPLRRPPSAPCRSAPNRRAGSWR